MPRGPLRPEPLILRANHVRRSGDTMTGLLVLSGDPVEDLGAATKQYVDDAVAGVGGGVEVRENSGGSTFGPRSRLNFIEGDDIELTVADDAGNDEVDITIASTAPLWPQSNKRLAYVTQAGNSVNPQVLGCTLPNFAGTVTATADATGSYLRCTSGTISGNTGGPTNNSFDDVVPEQLPDCTFVIRQANASIANCRMWIGMFQNGPLTSDTPVNHGAGFRSSSAIPDTNWQAWTNDNSGGGTTTDTGVAVPASGTPVVFRIKWVTTSSIEFYINGVLVATHTTNVPGSGTSLGMVCRAATLLGGVSKAMDFSHSYILHT